MKRDELPSQIQFESLLSSLSQEDLESVAGPRSSNPPSATPHITFATTAPTLHSNANSRTNSPTSTVSSSQQHRRAKSLSASTNTIRSGRRRIAGAHHRAKSSLSELFVSISGGLTTLAEDVVHQVEVVKGTFVEELERGDRGERFFLDMTMTRNLSVLPENITDFVHEAVGPRRRRTTSSIMGVSGDFYQPLEQVSTETTPLVHPFTKPLSTETTPLEGLDVVAAAAAAAALERRLAFGRYAALLGAVLAVSSNGTALSLLDGVSPPLKLYWRMTATAAALFPFALRTIVLEDSENTTGGGGGGIPKLHIGQLVTFGLAVICYSTHALLFVVALQYTSIANTVIYANSQALLLVLGKAFTGQPVVWMEGFGVFWAFCGAILCSKDSEGSSPSPVPNSTATNAALLKMASFANQTLWNTTTATTNNIYNATATNITNHTPHMLHSYDHAYLGDLLASGSAAAGVAYLTFAKAIRSHVPVTFFMFMVMWVGSFLILLFMLATGTHLTWSQDPFSGIFGWLTLEQDRLEIIIWIAVVCNVLGTMGFVRAMEFFDNLIIAVATLLEPMTAAFIAYAFGVGLLPGPLGWMGNIMVATGTFCVVYPSMDHHNNPEKGDGNAKNNGALH